MSAVGEINTVINRRRLLSGIAGLSTAAVAVASDAGPKKSAAKASALHERETIADTVYGKVRGTETKDGIRTFLGVPYGDDTSGPNRFMPPKKPKHWQGIRDATRWGSRSPQMSGSGGEIGLFFYFGADDIGPVGEDCLVLNIWAPRATAGHHKRPVMVRIHGGGFTSGCGSYPMYRGRNMALESDVVYVSLNHRLACAGFLDLSWVGDERYAHSGNAGMLDLVAALEWLRDNIENFGGDPSSVTLFGESGGGFKISTLLGMPSAQGLFHKAIIESGPGLSVRTPIESRELTVRYLRRMGLDKSKYLDLMKVSLPFMLEVQALAASNRFFPLDPPVPHTLAGSYGPVLDGDVIPKNMFDPVATPLSASVPVMVGYNKNEGTFFQFQDPQLFALDEVGLNARVKTLAPKDPERVLKVYKTAYPNLSPTKLLVQISTDAVMGANSVVLAERKAQLAAAPVYMYRFDWQSPAFDGNLGATHGLEIPFFTNNVDVMPVMTHGSPEATRLARQASSACVAFAKTGMPSLPDGPTWPPYSEQNRATMLLDSRCSVATDPITSAVRALWHEVLPGGAL
ncbi:MAG TPA: carboxylesterase/lipase family protein [Steroidobacteraceae bacterium]|jgi:para-nitrobenzyl esterase|nr:carboxylesterase/lipase family protein [Steroidobacteraceae bacterium]